MCSSFLYSVNFLESCDKSCDSVQCQVQAALDNNDAPRAKQLLQQYFGQMKQHLCAIDDDAFRQNMLRSVNILDRRLWEVKPNQHCSCDDIRKIIGGGILFPELVTGFFTGLGVGAVGFTAGGISSALDTGLYRLKRGDILGTLTGLCVGFAYGANKGCVNEFFTGFRIPFNLPDLGKCKLFFTKHVHPFFSLKYRNICSHFL